MSFLRSLNVFHQTLLFIVWIFICKVFYVTAFCALQSMVMCGTWRDTSTRMSCKNVFVCEFMQTLSLLPFRYNLQLGIEYRKIVLHVWSLGSSLPFAYRHIFLSRSHSCFDQSLIWGGLPRSYDHMFIVRAREMRSWVGQLSIFIPSLSSSLACTARQPSSRIRVKWRWTVIHDGISRALVIY